MRRCVMIILVMLLAATAAAQDVPQPPEHTQPPGTAPVLTAEVSREAIQKKIAAGVETILAQQLPDGSFRLDPKLEAAYPVGMTALAVLALQHAQPHLTGDVAVRAAEGVRKGIAQLSQTPPDGKTYSAGFAICAFFKVDPKRYSRHIERYAKILVDAQHKRKNLPIYGQWGYLLYDAKIHGNSPEIEQIRFWADNSNNQIAILGLYTAQRAGVQVPKSTWERAREAYLKSQNEDGGWGYMPSARPESYGNMTIASTISLYLCEEMLSASSHTTCKPPPPAPAIDKGMKWLVDHFEGLRIDTYGMYALERLGILMGQSTIGKYDWFDIGARTLVQIDSYPAAFSTPETGACFAVLYLSRGLEPVVINKLKRADTEDWNNDPYDVKHLTEYITDHYQLPVQWRIVTLEAPVQYLLRVPMLYVSGHDALKFTDDEKTKLKAYVSGGGTLVAQACCSRKAFDESFHALVEEVFGAPLVDLPKTHPMYTRMKSRGMAPRPKIEVLALENQGGRPGVIYLATHLCCKWQTGSDPQAFAAGAGIYLYVTTDARKLFERTPPAP